MSERPAGGVGLALLAALLFVAGLLFLPVAMPLVGVVLIVAGLLLRRRSELGAVPWALVVVGAVFVVYFALFVLGTGSGERGLHGILH